MPGRASPVGYFLVNLFMPMLSYTEENYLKSIYTLQYQAPSQDASVGDISDLMNTRPATVTDMLRKLSEKGLIVYEKYKRPSLSPQGMEKALQVVRKHRLWEVFLFEKLRFTWDEVHEVAEELEHVRSEKLVEKLDEFLGYPAFDPHGDPIPDAKGNMKSVSTHVLLEAREGDRLKIVAVKDTSSAFLRHLERLGLYIGKIIRVREVMPFDSSIIIEDDAQKTNMLSSKIASNLFIEKLA